MRVPLLQFEKNYGLLNTIKCRCSLCCFSCNQNALCVCRNFFFTFAYNLTVVLALLGGCQRFVFDVIALTLAKLTLQ